MEQSDLLRKIAVTFDKLVVRYAVVGSTASTLYGEPRLTNDIDVLAELQPQHVDAFCAEFSQAEYYLSRPAVESAVKKRFQFNIIHPSSGIKIDCFVAGGDEFDESQLRRSLSISRDTGAYSIRFATPEDVILKKMEYFQLGESEKHLRDIAGILRVAGERVDRTYIDEWAERKGLTEIWDAILARLASP
jgi:hypothetical protein